MTSAPEADVDCFNRRIERLYSAWNESIKTDAFLACVGRFDDAEFSYCKSRTIEEWLFGLDITDLLIVFCKSTIYFLASKKKIDFLKAFKDQQSAGMPKIELFIRDKAGGNKAHWDRIVSGIKSSNKGKTVGVFTKDKFPGAFFSECMENIFSSDNNFEKQDVSSGIAYILAVKEEAELNLIKFACNATETTYSRVLCKELTTIIDKEKKVSHRYLSEKLNEAVAKDASHFLEISQTEARHVETCYTPIIQSGGNYSLKFATSSNSDSIHFGSIVSSLGLRYKFYCSNISRTLMIDPTEDQKKNYEYLLRVSDQIINKLCDGVVLSDLFNQINALVKKERPDLVDKITKNFGFATGIEFRESQLVIGPKTNFVAKKNMTFIIAVGFSDLVNKGTSDAKLKNYALFLSDTVVVQDKGTPATLLTQKKRKLTKTIVLLKNADDDDDVEQEEKDDEVQEVMLPQNLRGGTRRRVLEERLRAEQNNNEKRRAHQKELLLQLNAAARDRLSLNNSERPDVKIKKSIIAYRSINDFPKENEISNLRIYVDKKNETLILPFYGVPVPFHISTIKNVSSSVEGDYTYLRINFFFPGSTLEKGSVFPNNDAIFLKELSYRSCNTKEPGEVSAPCQNLSDSLITIKNVQRKYKTRVDEEKELEGVVKQDSLIISSAKVGPKLKDLFIRPNIYKKRISGSLEAHTNGFRFTSIRNDKVDIMYNNIKHAIYQPCDGEMIILLHFNLKNPIMLNKKKHYDIQFYTEVGEITTDLGKRQHMHDRDDYAAESAERELRNRLKQAFKSFCDKVENSTKDEVQFEMPLRELGFYGVPKKSNVFLQPTASALVNLTDSEPTVITLSEIELVHFERVAFQLKNFDMVIIFKDYAVKPMSIFAIEMSKLEDIKNWLDKCDIKFTSGQKSFNWPVVMKEINSDLSKFFDENGGWKFLESDDSDDEAEDEEDDDDGQYTPSEDDDDDDEEEDEEEEETEEEDDDDDSGSDNLGSSEESGKDWSDLEEEAARADRNNGDYDDDSRRRRGGTSNGVKRKAYDDGRSSKRR